MKSVAGAPAALTPREVVILASIIEKEALMDQERPIIAGVYSNRLERGIGLYADPTIIFALKQLGTWDGNMRTPAGWLYAPIPFWHQRKSFEESDESVLGYIETIPGGLWVPMALEWDPSMQTASYRWACEAAFTYEGRIDGNKFSGVFRWASNPTETFDGVFVYTLQEEFVSPVPLDPKCGPSPGP